MTMNELPATLDGARITQQELRGRRIEAMGRLEDFIATRGDTMSKADAEIADRLESRVDAIDKNLEALQARWPEVREPSNADIRAAALPDFGPIAIGDGVTPEMIDAAKGIGSSPGGSVAKMVEARSGSHFEGAHASQFSLGRMVRGLVSGRWDNAELEHRALSVGTDSAGGYNVPELLAGRVIDRINAQARALEAGVTVIPMDSSTVHFPRITDGIIGGWRAENAAVTEDDAVFDRVTLEAKSLAVLVRLSQELVEDISEEGAAAIEREISNSIAVQLDAAVFTGTGANGQPTGIRNQSGVTLRSNGPNGASPSWGQYVDAVSTLRQANVEPNAIVTHPRNRALLAGLADSTGQPLRPPTYLDGIRQIDTTSIPANITTGTATNTTYAIAGDFSQCLLGVRPSFGVRVIRDSSRWVENLQVGLIAHLRADVQLAQPAAFAIETGLKSS